MLSFLVSLRIFYTLLVTSVVATGVLLVSYQRARQNLLLRTCCGMVLVTYVVIAAGLLNPIQSPDQKDVLCQLQATILNYCYICVHAHACFMMLRNCYFAMGWRSRIPEENREFTL